MPDLSSDQKLRAEDFAAWQSDGWTAIEILDACGGCMAE